MSLIDFKSVFADLGCDIKEKSGNFKCPFCGKYSFKIYVDQKAKCHTNHCDWYGDALQLVTDLKQISRNEAYKELAKSFDLKTIKLAAQSYEEAFDELAEGLHYLSWVRMYLAFYGDLRANQKDLALYLNITPSTLNKILNGNITSGLLWRKTIAALKSKININNFKKDINKDINYFKNYIQQNKEQFNVEKFRIKHKK